MAFLELDHLRKTFGANIVVEDFHLAIERGEFISFLGPSGCGKTTTLRMVAGFESPSAGTMRIDGRDVTQLRPNQRNIGMVFQSYALFPNMTVAQNVGFGLKVAEARRRDRAARRGDAALIKLPALGGASLPALRRPAAARRAGPRAGAEAAGAAARRAALGARRQDPRLAARGDPQALQRVSRHHHDLS
jgi:putative spermidine/putrescine transport system ATP-binding protein